MLIVKTLPSFVSGLRMVSVGDFASRRLIKVTPSISLKTSVRQTKWLMLMKSGFLRVLKTLEFQESDFKALKVLEIGFWSLTVLDFSLNKILKYQHF